MSIILDGKKLAQEIESQLKIRVETIQQQAGRVPKLVTVLVGNDPASKTYVNMKAKACERIGMASQQIHLAEVDQLSTDDLVQLIQGLNEDGEVDGILLQHPVPSHIDERACFDAIAAAKDVDGVTTAGFGRMSMGVPAYGSATPAGIMALLEHYQMPLAGKHAVVVGRSPILGKPMAAMLLNANATVTICHSKTEDLATHIKMADIVVGAVGRPEFIKGEWIKDNAIVVDAGYHPAGKVGDIELSAVKDRCYAYTPVPGGVGPMTITTLIRQSVQSAEQSLAIAKKSVTDMAF